MASNREERMQHRLRGAQRREVKDVDFGLSFSATSAPSQPAYAARKTPQPDQFPQLSTRKTSGRGRGRPSNTALVQENDSKEPIVHIASSANISAKRRKLDSDEAPSSSTRSTRSSLHLPRTDIYTLLEDHDLVPTLADTASTVLESNHKYDATAAVSNPISKITRTPPLSIPALDEITENPANNPSSGIRLHIGQNSEIEHTLQATRSTPIKSTNMSSPTTRIKRSPYSAASEQVGSAAKQSRGPRAQKVPAVDADELDELSPDQSHSRFRTWEQTDELNEPSPQKPSRRRRVFHQTNDIDELSPDKPAVHSRRHTAHAADQPSHVDEATNESLGKAEQIGDQEAVLILRRNRGRRVSMNITGSPDLDRVAKPKHPIVIKNRRKARKVSTPAQQRHPNLSKAKGNRKSTQEPTKSYKLRNGSPIPVTVHRLTKQHLYDANEQNNDVLNLELPYSRRSGVNAVDVLNQVCQEVIGSGLATLEAGRRESQQPGLRREYSTKWRALEAYGNELQMRLLEHTVNLDNAFSLEKRVRDEQRRRLALREDILRLRGEREQTALHMDEIRIAHENESKFAQERDSLSINIHDIELAIERGKEESPQYSDESLEVTGTELLLKRIGGQVSCTTGNGGVLRQVKGFNAFLERAALALENRKL